MQLSQSAEQILISVSNKATVGGAVTAGGSWMAESTDSILSITGPEVINACALAGVVFAAIGFMCSLFFQIRRERREQREHRARMEAMR